MLPFANILPLVAILGSIVFCHFERSEKSVPNAQDSSLHSETEFGEVNDKT
jgi:hypothetical protein